MLTDTEIKSAEGYVEKLGSSLNDLQLPSDSRTKVASACLAIAQDHHHAIVILLKEKLFAAAISLVRVEFEAYVRGKWLYLCASDAIISSFIGGKEPPKLDCLISNLEMLESFDEKVLSKMKRGTWNAMCAFTHTGGLHVQRWISENGIEPTYLQDDLIEALKFAEVIASWAGMGLANIANDDDLAVKTVDTFNKRMDEWSSFVSP